MSHLPYFFFSFSSICCPSAPSLRSLLLHCRGNHFLFPHVLDEDTASSHHFSFFVKARHDHFFSWLLSIFSSSTAQSSSPFFREISICATLISFLLLVRHSASSSLLLAVLLVLELLPVTVFELLLPCCYSPPCSIINSSTFLLSLPLRWRLQLLPLPLFQSTIIAVSSHLLEPTEPESCSFDPSSLVIIGLLKVLLSSSCSFFYTWTPPCRELSSPLRQASTSRWVSGDSC